jgi:hypothetical protein
MRNCTAAPSGRSWPREAARVRSALALAELDYLIGSRGGHRALMARIDEVTRAVYQLEPFPSEDLGHAKRVMGAIRRSPD